MFDKAKDKIDQASGTAQETYGEATDDVRQQFQGAAKKYAAKATSASRDVAENVCDQVKANPLASAAVAGAIGVMLGFLLGRR